MILNQTEAATQNDVAYIWTLICKAFTPIHMRIYATYMYCSYPAEFCGKQQDVNGKIWKCFYFNVCEQKRQNHLICIPKSTRKSIHTYICIYYLFSIGCQRAKIVKQIGSDVSSKKEENKITKRCVNACLWDLTALDSNVDSFD